MKSLKGKNIADNINQNFFSIFQDLLKVGAEKIQPFVIDFIYWLLETVKEESQLDMYSLKCNIVSNNFVIYLLNKLGATKWTDLLIKTIRIIEMMTDNREFFTFFMKNKGLELLLEILESSKDMEVTVLTYGYFLKGFKLQIFNYQNVSRRFIDVAIRDLK